jgi:hypothetical protein
VVSSKRAVALALQQRIGGNRGAHLDGVDLFRRDALVTLDTQQVADALDGGILVGFRVFRQQLVRLERCRPARATRSVNVPPRSIQKSHLVIFLFPCRRPRSTLSSTPLVSGLCPGFVPEPSLGPGMNPGHNEYGSLLPTSTNYR